MSDPLDRVDVPEVARELSKIRELYGQRLPAQELRNRIPGFKIFAGIYKPAFSKCALWIRETRKSPYSDEKVVYHADGSWTYRYSPQSQEGVADSELYANRSMEESRARRWPVGVFREVPSGSSRTEYEVLGLAFVEGFDGDHFLLRGEAIDWTVAPAVENVVPTFRPFETKAPGLSQTVRVQRNSRFGEVVRRIYDQKCAVCEIGFQLRGRALGLEAAHIIPVEEGGIIGDVRNGVLLCRNHHALFDQHAWTIDEDLRVGVAAERAFRESAAENHIVAVEGKRLPNLPSLVEDQPAKEAARWRLTAFERYWSGQL